MKIVKVESNYIKDIYEDKVFHWIKFLETKNGYYLRKESLKGEVKTDNSDNAFTAYCYINDQIIECFGKDESFLTYIDNEEKIALLKLDYIINKNGFSQTLYELEEAKKEGLKQDDPEYDINKEIGIISQRMGGGVINIKDVTIHQYLTAKTLLKNG